MRICQIVGVSEDSDQNGVRVSKKDACCHICIIRQKSVSVIYEKYGTLSINLSFKPFGLNPRIRSTGLETGCKPVLLPVEHRS